jgi:hypothetical protein
MQHSITPLLGQIALTQPGGVLGHYPVEKQMIVPLNTNQMGWRIAAECCGSQGQSIQNISRILNVSSNAVAKPSSAMMKLALMCPAIGK